MGVEHGVDELLDLWQRTKPRYDGQGHLVGEEYDVWTELGIRAEDLRAGLNLVAYEAHRDQPTLQGTHDIRARDLAGVLYVLYGGIATPSEAAGVGALLCIVLVVVIYGLFLRSWSYRRIWEILGDSSKYRRRSW